MDHQTTDAWRQPANMDHSGMDPLMGKWYAVQVRPRSEQFVALLLDAKGYKHYLPTRKISSGSRSMSTVCPLFPGYIFCRWDIPFPKPIVATPGVIRIIGAGRVPTPVDEDELHSVMKIAQCDVAPRPMAGLYSGSQVRITDGPLKGVQGIVQTSKNRHRLLVSITLLNRSLAVDIDANSVATFQTL